MKQKPKRSNPILYDTSRDKMSKEIVIRISGNAVDISPDGRSGLPDTIKELLEPQLQYIHVTLLRGMAAYDLTGIRKPIRHEKRLLYQYDKYGRLVCGAGFITRVTNILESHNYRVTLQDCNSEHPRKDRFNEDWDNVVRNFTFRAKQDDIVTAIACNYRGIVSAPTGIGKTHLQKAICLLYPNANIVITTKRTDIINSTRLELAKYLPNVGQMGGGQKKIERVTVCTADSLHRMHYDDVDILIGEEVHELAAPTYSAELAKFRYCRMYGFTATPTGRMDNADIKLESLFGSIIFHMSYQEAVELELVVPIKVSWLDVQLGTNPAHGMVDVHKQRHGIWRNVGRNQLIANAAQAFSDGEQVLIMVTTFDHAVHLRQFLPEFTLCYAERSDDKAFDRFVKNGMLPEDEPVMTSARRQQLRQQFEKGTLNKVIATDVWSTGVSFNQLGVLIRADARSSEIMDSQIPGRVCRLHAESNKQHGLVIDCLDQFDPGFRDAARKRKRNYEAKGWEQDLPRYGRNTL